MRMSKDVVILPNSRPIRSQSFLFYCLVLTEIQIIQLIALQLSFQRLCFCIFILFANYIDFL